MSRVKVGDWVSFTIGTRHLIARVVTDMGNIGVNGRQLVVVAVRGNEDNGFENTEFQMPAEELEVVEAPAA